MTVTQQIEFYSKGNENIASVHSSESMIAKVLSYFLDWPYQEYFMRTINLMWDFLPEQSFANLLAEIYRKIEIESEKGTLQYGGGKVYNYRKLLIKFWCESLKSYKRYLFSRKERTYVYSTEVCVVEGKYFILKLFLLENFTNEDGRNIDLVLESVTDEEKRDIFSSIVGEDTCIELINRENWLILNLFESSCGFSPEEKQMFKRKLSISDKAKLILVDFVKKEKLDAAESFLRWSTLSEEEIIQLKREMIHSWYADKVCGDLISKNGVKSVITFITWFNSSEEELKACKKEFINSENGVQTCYDLILEFKFELVDEFSRWCIPNKEEHREFKKHFGYCHGSKFCLQFISLNRSLLYFGENVSKPLWEQVEMFLTWCFTSEEEISVFKKNIFLEYNASDIHFDLICNNKWDQAETFIAWLNLSFEEVRDFKRKTLMTNMEEFERTLREGYPEKCEDYPGGK